MTMILERELTIAEAEQLVAITSTYMSAADRLRVMEALEFARREHGDQRRNTGELFFTHPLTVATYLAGYRLDATAISAALLHDIAEDAPVSLAQIEAEFGSELERRLVWKARDGGESILKAGRIRIGYVRRYLEQTENGSQGSK